MSSILDQFDLKGAQQRATSDDSPAIVVTAGAGSGKTRALVARYLRLLEAGYPLRSLIAITFTRKAAREMRARVRTEIERWVNPPLPLGGEGAGVRGESWQTLAAELDSARISTIHSLCAEILRAHPAEAGVDPHFSVLEEGLAATLRAQAIETALDWAAGDPQAAALFEIFTEMEVSRVLGTLLNFRLDIPPSTGRTDSLQGWSLAAEAWFYTHLSDSAWKTLEVLDNLQANQPDDKLELARRSVLALWGDSQQAIQNKDWDAALGTLARLRKAISTGGQKGSWDADDLTTAREAMRELREYYDAKLKPLIGSDPPKVRWALDEQAASALPALDSLIEQVLREYQTLKDEQQALDTDDLEGRAAQLLTENERVRARWQHGTRAVLLVDEFQDTNERQRQIVYALAGFTSARLPKSAQTSEVSSLFVVGDAKQSIYKFRGADVTVFRQVQTDIAAAGGVPLDFDLTFRAHKPLLDGINALLAPILGEGNDPARPYEIPFAPLRAYRQMPKSEAVAAPYIEFILGLGEDAALGRAAAAGSLTVRLQELHEQEDFAWGDMALLFRASTAFDVYEDALEAAGIPFVTVAGRGFYDRPEIRDLLNALAAIADPTDDLAMAGLLRSPAIGLSDADLYNLRFTNESDNPCPLWEAMQTCDVSEDRTGLKARALDIISDLRDLVGRSPAAEVLKRYLDLTGYRAILGQAPGGSRTQRNVDKLLADAHRSRMVSLEDFLLYVQTLRNVDTREGEAPVEAAGAVQLMTVHKAKGLEFPLVVIADAAYSPPSWSAPVLLDEELGLLPGLRAEDGARPLTWKLSTLAEAERDEAEDKRLLYVAATRAQEKLLINGHVQRLKKGNLSLRGWLGRFGEIIGLGDVILNEDVTAPIALDVQFSEPLACTLHPPMTLPRLPAPRLPTREKSSEAGDLPKLAAPLRVPEECLLDEKILARESDPPQRVWRVVPRAKRPSGPAWVVGKLVHEAIHYWRFPDDEFETFITPFALEAGLTDVAEIQATIRAVEQLLKRFWSHPLWAEMNAAERYHEVSYVTPDDRGIIDLLYRSGDSWVIADFKTDELRSEVEVEAAIQREGYDQQIQRYAEAAAAQLGAQPKLLLVFLQVESGLWVAKL